MTTPPPVADSAFRRVLFLAAASGWMVVGRGVGLLWMLFLVHAVGLGGYGVYAVAFAGAALLAAPLENIFLVRSVRVDEASFAGERSTRALIGLTLFIGGAVAFPWFFVPALVMLVAGGEMLFNAVKSRALREGRPAVTTRWDAIRQIASIVLAVGVWLVTGQTDDLSVLMLAYLVPYLVVAAISLRLVWGVRPRRPGHLRAQVLLVVDALVTALYLQGDILILGALFGDEVVGAYAIASQLVLAASIIGQLFGQQFTAAMRADADRHPGPPLKLTLLLGAVITLGAVALSVILLLNPSTSDVGGLLLLLAPFAGLRAISNTWVTVLYVRSMDRARVASSAIALGLRALCVAVLILAGVAGGVAAAVAAALAEVLLVACFAVILYRRRRGPIDPADDAAHLVDGRSS